MQSERYCDSNAVNDLIHYVSNEEKTKGYYGGVNCCKDVEEAIDEFIEVKEQFDQSTGQQLKHILISYDCRINRKLADEIASAILNDYLS